MVSGDMVVAVVIVWGVPKVRRPCMVYGLLGHPLVIVCDDGNNRLWWWQWQ